MSVPPPSWVPKSTSTGSDSCIGEIHDGGVEDDQLGGDGAQRSQDGGKDTAVDNGRRHGAALVHAEEDVAQGAAFASVADQSLGNDGAFFGQVIGQVGPDCPVPVDFPMAGAARTPGAVEAALNSGNHGVLRHAGHRVCTEPVVPCEDGRAGACRAERDGALQARPVSAPAAAAGGDRVAGAVAGGADPGADDRLRVTGNVGRVPSLSGDESNRLRDRPVRGAHHEPDPLAARKSSIWPTCSHERAHGKADLHGLRPSGPRSDVDDPPVGVEHRLVHRLRDRRGAGRPC